MSTQVDFYILPDQSNQWLPIACELIEKTFHQGCRIIIETSDDAMKRQLDTWLWTFRATSFVPHIALPQDQRMINATPVIIKTVQDDLAEGTECLVNLSLQHPTHWEQFTRILEIIPGDPDRLAQGRQRYRFYKQQGFKLNHHKMNHEANTDGKNLSPSTH